MKRTYVKHAIMAIVCFAFGLGASPPLAIGGPILYNNFGAGDTFGVASPYGVDGNSGFQAFRFVPTASGVLDQITVALGRTGAAQASTVFQLYNGPTADALGALIETFVVTNSVTPDDTPPFTGAPVTWFSRHADADGRTGLLVELHGTGSSQWRFLSVVS
jgi:hypothetical protein